MQQPRLQSMLDRNKAIAEEFRSNQGKVGGAFLNKPVLLLTAKGAKSGESHLTPLMYNVDGERLLVFASMGGAPKNPGWYYNLLANPDVTVEVGTEKFPAKAQALKGTERDRLYSKQAKEYPQFDDYQKRTTRKIPVIALIRT